MMSSSMDWEVTSQLWVEKGDAFTLTAPEKEVLTGLAALFENYADASPAERQQTLEEATKRIDAALKGGQQQPPVNANSTRADSGQPSAVSRQQENVTSSETALLKVENRKQSTTRSARVKKDTQPEVLSLFGETENRSESTPIKREPDTDTDNT